MDKAVVISFLGRGIVFLEGMAAALVIALGTALWHDVWRERFRDWKAKRAPPKEGTARRGPFFDS